ncbi:MAG: leucine-rich repeat domain-containing protein [Crocinitomicaceae bacterium]|nr:leucine-rich repeat domain-containing protein [Crocinitomicaceae bacterium]
MIKKQFALTLILWCSLALTGTGSFLHAQELTVYDWNEVQTANPDSIFAISFEKDKLTELPEGLAKFTSVKQLNLAKNKLSELPDFIFTFDSLQELNVTKNKLCRFPIGVCKLENLKRLLIGSNDIASVPDCIEYVHKLEYLDLYDNPIGHLPQSMMRLKNLQKVDFSGIRFNKEFQKQWTEQLPNTELVFDSPCDCMN